MEWHQPIIEICAAFMGKIEGDSIAAAFWNWAAMDSQRFVWGLSELHNNELQWVVYKLSYQQSVLSICLCIALYQYAWNVPMVWLVSWLCVNTATCPFDYPWCKTNNCWCSIDTHY
jgi:hypothetical protein